MSKSDDSQAMFDKGKAAYEKGDLKQAKKLFKSAADVGHSGGMVGLGAIAHDAEDLVEAKRWYQLAADVGNSYAMFNLGVMAKNAEDLSEAKRWWKLAAGAGDSDALYQFGQITADTNDLDEAKRWYQLAADAGNSEAILNLGRIAYQDHDLAEAKRCYESAAEAGETQAMFALGFDELGFGDLQLQKRWLKKLISEPDLDSSSERDILVMLLQIATSDENIKDAKFWSKRLVEYGEACNDPQYFAMFALITIGVISDDFKLAGKYVRSLLDGYPESSYEFFTAEEKSFFHDVFRDLVNKANEVKNSQNPESAQKWSQLALKLRGIIGVDPLVALFDTPEYKEIEKLNNH